MPLLAQTDPVAKLADLIIRSIDSPFARAVRRAYKQNGWAQFKETIDSFHPGNYDPLQTVEFRHDYLAASLLKKYPGLQTGISLDEKAKELFWQSEKQCFRSNEALAYLLPNSRAVDQDSRDPGGRIRAVVHEMRKWISDTLGPVPERGRFEPKFGPGAVFESKGYRFSERLTLLDKLGGLQPAITPDALGEFEHYYHQTAWFSVDDSNVDVPCVPKTASEYLSPCVVPGNRFTTVPKDAFKNRGICVEPGGNVWLQLGIGKYMRSRLQRKGLLLSGGRSERLHHSLAREGSYNGTLATMDCSNASDTICKVLVQAVLPPAWFELLNSVRSKKSLIDGRWVLLEKFSSMGNGFTFELETLLFAAMAKAIGSSRFSVYGDDIIVESEKAADMSALLRYLGFSLNEKKTFVDGWFRESCGGDFLMGEWVRPFHLEEVPTEPIHWVRIHNKLFRFTAGLCEEPTNPFYKVWLHIRDQIPAHIVRTCRGPVSLGDEVLHSREPIVKVVDGNDYIACSRLIPTSRVIPLKYFSSHAILAYALLGGDSAGPTPRGEPDGYHVRRWRPPPRV